MKIPDEILEQLEMRSIQLDPIPYSVTVKPQMRVCDDCEQTVENRTTVVKFQHYGTNPGWREHCETCKCSRIPGETEWMPRPRLERLIREQKKKR